MRKLRKCGKGMMKAIFSCAGVVKNQDPFSVGSCFWEIKDATATCWKEAKENKESSFQINQERIFMEPKKHNFRPRYVRPIKRLKPFDFEEEKELRNIVEKLNMDKTIKKGFKPKIESGILIVSCNNCGHKQQIKLVKPSDYQKFKCENCNCESEFNFNV